MSLWWSAARPRTLPAAAAPVLMGTAMAIREGSFHALAAIAALVAALLLQIGTNFANDYFDFVKGADTEDRLGPTRATAAGLIAPATMKRAFVITFALAFAVGTYLMIRGGWPIVIIGVLSIACGILYTGGPKPLGYVGLGDVTVLIFFGPVALAGTHYVQALVWSETAILVGLAPGCLAAALLAVNNLRDVDTDRVAGKRTLAVRFGRGFAKLEYAVCLAVAAGLPVVLWAIGSGPLGATAATGICLTAIPAMLAVVRARPGDRLLAPLAATGRTLALYGLAFAIGWGATPGHS